MPALYTRFLLSIFFVFVVVVSGTIGYAAVEGWPLFDSLYMTVITLTTIGYQELKPLSQAGRAFTLGLVFVGIGVFAYAVNNGIRIVFEGEFQRLLGRRKLERRLLAMKDHYIVCGYGRMGKIICRELKGRGVPLVVVEVRAEERDADDDTIVITGDATKDENLVAAGIERARGLISVLSTDADNLFVVLSARGLNPNLFIVARAGEEGSEQKLLRAGANRVISPYHIGGLRIAHTILKPAVVDFLEFATRSGNLELQLEEIVVREGSRLAGKTLGSCGLGRDLGVMVVAIATAEGEMKFTPLGDTVISPGDKLISIGEQKGLEELERLAGGVS